MIILAFPIVLLPLAVINLIMGYALWSTILIEINCIPCFLRLSVGDKH